MKNQACANSSQCGRENPDSGVNTQRRRMMNIVATSLVAPLPFASSEAFAQPVTTLLVEADAEADFKPLRPTDLVVAKPLLLSLIHISEPTRPY